MLKAAYQLAGEVLVRNINRFPEDFMFIGSIIPALLRSMES